MNREKNAGAPWRRPPAQMDIADGAVHVWRVDLAAHAGRAGEFTATLDDDERARAARFVFERDRAHFAVSHAAMRDILARYVGAEPADVRLACDNRGKPVIAGMCSLLDLRFNMAHSGDLALVAVARGREVGVDVEFMRSDLGDMDIAERFFSAAEVADLRSLDEASRARAFFACWTRKEAYLKARGLGLLAPLDSFRVSLLPAEPCALLSSDFDPSELSRWSLLELHPRPRYAAALAVEGEGHTLSRWAWPSPAKS